MEEIGRRLRWTRIALNMSQAKVARDAFPEDSNPAQTWNNWERGRDRISLDKALILCSKYRLTLDWIYRGDDGLLPAQLARDIEAAQAADRKALRRA